jgi:hypothetical protein
MSFTTHELILSTTHLLAQEGHKYTNKKTPSASQNLTCVGQQALSKVWVPMNVKVPYCCAWSGYH